MDKPSDDFIRALPKAELHLHLEGSVDPPTLSELSRRHPMPMSTTNNRYTNIEESGRVFTEDEARALYQYTNFTGFLLTFKAVTERLRTADDYELITYRMMQKLHAQNVRHAEVYISAGVVHWRGQEFAPLFEGCERGRLRGERDFGMTLYWILDAVRHFGVDEARRVVDEAIGLKNQKCRRHWDWRRRTARRAGAVSRGICACGGARPAADGARRRDGGAGVDMGSAARVEGRPHWARAARGGRSRVGAIPGGEADSGGGVHHQQRDDGVLPHGGRASGA